MRRIALGIATALTLASSATALGQPDAALWYARVWPVDAQTVLAVRASTGQEVRRGRRGLRHGIRVPLVVEDGGDTVRFEIESGPDYAVRWVLRRDEGHVRIEEWVRRGTDDAAWERLRVVVVREETRERR